MHRTRAFVVLAMLALAACSSAQAPVDFAPPGSSTRTTPPASSGSCFSRLMPVEDNATWSYLVASNVAPRTSYTDRITKTTSDGFTVTTVLSATDSDGPPVAKNVEWSCSSDGLTALQFGGGASASLSTSGTTASFTTTNVTGVTLPPDPQPGDTWSQSFDISGTQDIGGASAKTSGKVALRFTAKDVGSVSVPAGKFDALAVDQAVKFSLTVSVAGVSQEVNFTFGGTSWFADGVGMVKSTSSGSFGQGGNIESTIELTNSSLVSSG